MKKKLYDRLLYVFCSQVELMLGAFCVVVETLFVLKS